MKKLSTIHLLFILFMACLFPASRIFSQKQISLVFHHHAGNEELVLEKAYTNPLGEVITVQKFKYYLSNFSITTQKGKTIVLPVQYFLVDEADAASKIIQLAVPDAAIASIHFLLGVDSLRNVSGIQTDALDPMKGMFWTWNSGYIMAKLEGSSESSHIAGHAFTFHIGGFKGEQNTIKTISLALPEKKEVVTEIHIVADINTWFNNKSAIRTAETPVCHTPGPLAMKIADNYSGMFTINAIR